MTKAVEICAAVEQALAAGRTVYITDATETRKVVSVEFLAAIHIVNLMSNRWLSWLIMETARQSRGKSW